MKTRNTRQKEIINKEINKFKTFFTVEDLHKKVRLNDNTIGIATIYRFLKTLRKNNDIFSYTCNNKLIYSKENKSHCHFVCEKTNKITHFTIDSLEFLKDKIPGSITSVQIEVKGVCTKHRKS